MVNKLLSVCHKQEIEQQLSSQKEIKKENQ